MENMKSEFHLDETIVLLNCGSFGISPNCVLEAKKKYSLQIQTCSDRFYRLEYPLLLSQSAEAAGKYFHCDPKGIAFVDNATTASDILFKNWDLGPGRDLLLTNFTYGSIRWQAENLAKKQNFNIFTLNLEFPIESDEEFVNLFNEIVKQNQTIKFALVDHITSSGSILFPVKEITNALQRVGVSVAIDGAHAAGQILHLNIQDIGADFYFSNLHKWFFAPQSIALLFVKNDKDRKSLEPTIISWKHFEDNLLERFSYLGTRDPTNCCLVPDIIDFIQRIGGEETIYAYRSELLQQGIDYLKKHLDFIPLPVPKHAPFQTTFILSQRFQAKQAELDKISEGTFQRRMHNLLINDYGINVIMFRLVISKGISQWCMRVSVNVINTMKDFEKLADAFLRYASDLEEGKYAIDN